MAAKPVNDTILLSISFTLPGGFAFVIADLEFNIVVDTASDWNANAQWLVAAPTPQTLLVDFRTPIAMDLTANSGTANGVRAARVSAGVLNRAPILPGQSGTFTSLRYTNLAAAAGAAGTVDAAVSFWEYDLEQISYYPVHSAASMYAR